MPNEANYWTKILLECEWKIMIHENQDEEGNKMRRIINKLCFYMHTLLLKSCICFLHFVFTNDVVEVVAYFIFSIFLINKNIRHNHLNWTKYQLCTTNSKQRTTIGPTASNHEQINIRLPCSYFSVCSCFRVSTFFS